MRTITAIIVSLMTIAIHGQTMLTQPANAFTGTDRLQMRQVSCVDCREDSLCWDFSNMETMNPKYTVWHVDKSDSLQQVTTVVERGTRHTYRQQGDSLLISGYRSRLSEVIYDEQEVHLLLPMAAGDSIQGFFHGLDTYDYGARQYNPVTARWDRMDPLCEKYYSISPYAYCLDNPIMCIDPDGRNIYMLFYTVGNKDEEADRMFKAAAETRKQDIMKSKEFDSSKDIVILSSISNLGSLGDIVNNIIDTYSEKYGKTAEFGFWSHSAFDGPAGTKTTSHDLTGNNQMSMEGWGKINFNWEENASAYFYGCRSGVPSKSGVSFTTNLSRQENFHNVSIYGQTSYSYPSKYTNIRETATNMLFGHFSYPTYMVGGYKKNGHLAYLSIIPALPMRRSVNGKEDLNKIYYQPGRKF